MQIHSHRQNGVTFSSLRLTTPAWVSAPVFLPQTCLKRPRYNTAPENPPRKYKYNIAAFQLCKQTRPPKFLIRAGVEDRKYFSGDKAKATPPLLLPSELAYTSFHNVQYLTHILDLNERKRNTKKSSQNRRLYVYLMLQIYLILGFCFGYLPI